MIDPPRSGIAHDFPKVALPDVGDVARLPTSQLMFGEVAAMRMSCRPTPDVQAYRDPRSSKAVNPTAPDGRHLLQITTDAYFGASRMCRSQFSLNGAQMTSLATTISKMCPICVANRSVSKRKTLSGRGPRFT